MRRIRMRQVRMRRVRMHRGRALRTIVSIALTVGVAGTLAPVAAADTPRSLEYWLADYGFQTAWATTRGAGVTVAVIDTGIDGTIAELSGVVTGGTDVSGRGDANGQKPVGEDSQHATLVASLLAGRGTGPDSGVIGVAPEASLLSVSVGVGVESGGTATSAPSPSGSGSPSASVTAPAPTSSADATLSIDDQIAKAVRWSVDNGADVINMSLTRNSLQWPTSWDDAFGYAFENDVVVVAAAGNRASGTTEVGAPATIPGVLTVAGVDRNGGASFDASSQGITIAVAAPSEQLVGALPGGGYASWQGTSGAAPLVAGLVALVRSAYPDLDAANVINRVISTARPVGGVARSPIYGRGLIDAAAAVTAPVEAVDANPMGDLAEWIRIHRRGESTPEPEVTTTSSPLPLPPAEETPVAQADDSSKAWSETGLPLALIAGIGTLVLLGVIGATRQFKRALRR